MFSAPEITHGVSIVGIPFRPFRWEVSNLIAAFTDIPGFSDEFDLREHRVLVDDVEERGETIYFENFASQG